MKVKKEQLLSVMAKAAQHAEKAIKLVADGKKITVIGTGRYSQFKGTMDADGKITDFAISKDAVTKITDAAYFAAEYLCIETDGEKIVVKGDTGKVSRQIPCYTEEVAEINVTSADPVSVTIPMALLTAVAKNATYVSNSGNKYVAIGFTNEGGKVVLKLTSLCGGGFIGYSRTPKLTSVSDGVKAAAEKKFCVAISNAVLNTSVFDGGEDATVTVKLAENMVVVSDGKAEVTGITVRDFGKEPSPTAVFNMLAGFPENTNHCQVSANDVAKALSLVETGKDNPGLARILLREDGLYIADNEKQANGVILSATVSGKFDTVVRKDNLLSAVNNLANADKQVIIGVGDDGKTAGTVLVYSSKAAYSILMPIKR